MFLRQIAGFAGPKIRESERFTGFRAVSMGLVVCFFAVLAGLAAMAGAVDGLPSDGFGSDPGAVTAPDGGNRTPVAIEGGLGVAAVCALEYILEPASFTRGDFEISETHPLLQATFLEKISEKNSGHTGSEGISAKRPFRSSARRMAAEESPARENMRQRRTAGNSAVSCSSDLSRSMSDLASCVLTVLQRVPSPVSDRICMVIAIGMPPAFGLSGLSAVSASNREKKSKSAVPVEALPFAGGLCLCRRRRCA